MKAKLLKELHTLKSLIESSPKPVRSQKLRDYGYRQIDLRANQIRRCEENIGKMSFELPVDDGSRPAVARVIALANENPQGNLPELISLVSGLADSAEQLQFDAPANIPSEIQAHVAADLREMQRCYNSKCYRAATILLGRVLEACLHRKYYDATGLDILEKNPGIGLGKLIAKLAEKNVELDPGLTQQVHLINQVRIHSVHVKKTGFYPSAQQTYAMILFTLDVIDKMF